MRNFFVLIYKNSIILYVCGLMIFGYHQFMSQIPDEMYVREGEKIELGHGLLVDLSINGHSTEEMVAAVPGTTYDSSNSAEKMLTDSCRVTCYLFGVFPIREIQVNVVEGTRIYASGRVIGIYEQTNGVLVLKTTEFHNRDGQVCNPAGNKVMSGDYITAVNGKKVDTKEALVREVRSCGENKLTLSILRKKDEIEVEVTPEAVDTDQYILGIWVKDDVAGIGTMTYYNADAEFGALGHGIGDGETGQLLEVEKGKIYNATLQGIAKGEKGAPGELEGSIYYNNDCCLGDIRSNSELGIYGQLEQDDFEKYHNLDTSYEVEFKQNVHAGKAQILSDVSGEVKDYEIEITDLVYQPTDNNKGIHFVVTDPELLKLTGGIVQGMSGSPILQDGKICGAVTHVLVNSPEKGYGVFIETMLKNN